MPVRAVFLDVGWTLAYPQRSIWEIFASLCSEHGVGVSAEDCERTVGDLRLQMRQHQEQSFHAGAAYSDSDAEFGRMFEQMAALLLARFSVPASADEFQRRFLSAFWTDGNWKAFADVDDALLALKERGLRVGVLSNAPTDLPVFLERLGVAPHLDFAVVSASEGVRKPDRRIFEIALERAGVAPHEALHVGDMYLEDILGGRAAGVQPLLIERNPHALFPNYRESDGNAIEARDVVRDLHDVVRRIDAAE